MHDCFSSFHQILSSKKLLKIRCHIYILMKKETTCENEVFCSTIFHIHFQIPYSIFYIQIWFKCETPLLFCLIRTIVYRKILFIEKNSFFCWRLCKNYWITYCTHMTSLVIWIDEIVDVMISRKNISKS